MKKPLFLIFLLSLCNFSWSSDAYKNSSTPKTGTYNFAPSGISFQENKGQLRDQNYNARPNILFSGKSNGLFYFLKSTGLHYQFILPGGKEANRQDVESDEFENFETSYYRVDVSWLGANPNAEIIKGEALRSLDNYYNVPNGSEPALNVKRYRTITYKNIYNQIDIAFFENPEGGLEYDFIVHPGGNPEDIQIQIEGADLEISDSNELRIITPFGEIREGSLRVYQKNRTIPCKWSIEGDKVKFNLSKFDPEQKLVIDPPVRLWGTLFGGSMFYQSKSSLAIDGAGHVYIAGMTDDPQLIVTSGAHQITVEGSYDDAFLAKFNADGQRLWGTMLGGEYTDGAFSCAANENYVYIAGQTSSPANIATPGAHQSYLNISDDGFIAQFDNTGVLQWSTYYGGDVNDIINSIEVDDNGDIYFAGGTWSDADIATSGTHQPQLDNDFEGFLVKFNEEGQRLWGTYYGGNGDDEVFHISINDNNYVYITGDTDSEEGIASTGVHQEVLTESESSSIDGFVAKFSPIGFREWGTYYGGEEDDVVHDCSFDQEGNIYLVGNTTSQSGIATPNSFRDTYEGLGQAGFLVKLNSNANRIWATYFASCGWGECRACETDSEGNVYIAGYSSCNDLYEIATPDGLQTALENNNRDSYLVKFNGEGIRKWGTLYGGDYDEETYECVMDNDGSIYLSGITSSQYSTDSLISEDAHQSEYYGSPAFLARFNMCTPAITGSINISSCEGYESPSGNYYWETSGIYVDTVQAVNGCDSIITFDLTITSIENSVSINQNTLTADVSDAQYQWIDCNDNNQPIEGASGQAFTPQQNGSYAVIITQSPCQVTSECIEVTGVGIENITPEKVRVFPNPARDEVIVETALSGKIRIINSSGKVLIAEEILSKRTRLNVSELSIGLYMLRFSSEEGTEVKKLVIQHSDN